MHSRSKKKLFCKLLRVAGRLFDVFVFSQVGVLLFPSRYIHFYCMYVYSLWYKNFTRHSTRLIFSLKLLFTILPFQSLSGCLHMNSRLRTMNSRVMNSNFSENIVLVQFGNHMCIFVFNLFERMYTVILKKVSLEGILPNGNMLTVIIGPIQYSSNREVLKQSEHTYYLGVSKIISNMKNWGHWFCSTEKKNLSKSSLNYSTFRIIPVFLWLRHVYGEISIVIYHLCLWSRFPKSLILDNFTGLWFFLICIVILSS